MDRKVIVLCIVLFVVGVVLGYGLSRIGVGGVTGNVVQNDEDNNYSWTKAICNDGKCIDVLIECSNGNVVSLKPMSNVVEMTDNSIIGNSSELCE